jgi:hypothetical protein
MIIEPAYINYALTNYVELKGKVTGHDDHEYLMVMGRIPVRSILATGPEKKGGKGVKYELPNSIPEIKWVHSHGNSDKPPEQQWCCFGELNSMLPPYDRIKPEEYKQKGGAPHFNQDRNEHFLEWGYGFALQMVAADIGLRMGPAPPPYLIVEDDGILRPYTVRDILKPNDRKVIGKLNAQQLRDVVSKWPVIGVQMRGGNDNLLKNWEYVNGLYSIIR